MARENKIAILIPAYNEEKYIAEVIKNCTKFCMDIIIVNDGSADRTASIIRSLPQPVSCRIILIEHPRNCGKGKSLVTGFNYIVSENYKGVITMDADGQHDINEIPHFMEKLENENPDIIVGNRLDDTKGMPFIRLATNLFTSWLISVIAGKKIKDVQSGYRYINMKVLKNIKIETTNFDTEPEILLKAAWLNYNISNIPISTIYHKDFVSHVNPVTDTIKFFKLIFRSLRQKRKVSCAK
ncbi:MAG: glycosyltransferase family 2 protein [Actinomycetota bacterium]